MNNKPLREDTQRLWDFVRCFRSELHEDGLITNEEYMQLLQDTKSRSRLDSYAARVKEARALAEVLKAENKRLRAAIARVRDIPDPTGDIREALEVEDEQNPDHRLL